MKSVNKGIPNKEIILKLNRGGDVGKALIALCGLAFNCTCSHRITISNFYGYRHGGGVKDQYGITWWMYVRCPKCDYDWALWKIRQNIKKH